MKRLLLLALAIGCSDNPNGPSGLYTSYHLVTIDGRFLPGRDNDTPADAEMISASLVFPETQRPRRDGTGVATYTRHLRRANQPLELVSAQLNYSITDGVLRIDLCRLQPSCFAITNEWVGPVESFELLLTHYLGGNPGHVYRFAPALLE